MGDCDTGRPWGPDALSASTAEAATDASRPSMHPSSMAVGAYELALHVCKHIHMEDQGALPSIKYPSLTSPSYIPGFLPFYPPVLSLLLTGTKEKEMLWSVSPVKWLLTLIALALSVSWSLQDCSSFFSCFLFSFFVGGHTVAYCKPHLLQNGSE